MDKLLAMHVAKAMRKRWYDDSWNEWNTITKTQQKRWLIYAEDAIAAVNSYKHLEVVKFHQDRPITKATSANDLPVITLTNAQFNAGFMSYESGVCAACGTHLTRPNAPCKCFTPLSHSSKT